MLGAILVLLLLILLWYHTEREGFESRRDRASRIYQWVGRYPVDRRRYENYRREVGGTIVEYERVRRLTLTGDTTVEDIYRAIG